MPEHQLKNVRHCSPASALTAKALLHRLQQVPCWCGNEDSVDHTGKLFIRFLRAFGKPASGHRNAGREKNCSAIIFWQAAVRHAQAWDLLGSHAEHSRNSADCTLREVWVTIRADERLEEPDVLVHVANALQDRLIGEHGHAFALDPAVHPGAITHAAANIQGFVELVDMFCRAGNRSSHREHERADVGDDDVFHRGDEVFLTGEVQVDCAAGETRFAGNIRHGDGAELSSCSSAFPVLPRVVRWCGVRGER